MRVRSGGSREIPKAYRGYTSPRAAKFAEMPTRTLQFWAHSGFYRPSVAYHAGQLHLREKNGFVDEDGVVLTFPPETEMYYSFGDLVALKIIHNLIRAKKIKRRALAHAEHILAGGHPVVELQEGISPLTPEEAKEQWGLLIVVPLKGEIPPEVDVHDDEITDAGTLIAPRGEEELQTLLPQIEPYTKEAPLTVPLWDEMEEMKEKVLDYGVTPGQGTWLL